jgi:hypothetical protein
MSNMGDENELRERTLAEIDSTVFEAKMEGRRLALRLAERSAEVIAQKIVIVELERKTLEVEEAEMRRRGGTTAAGGGGLSLLASTSSSASSSPFKTSGGTEAGKQVVDIDGRTIEITNKITLNDRLKSSYPFKRSSDPARHRFFMRSCLTELDAKQSLQVIHAKSFDTDASKNRVVNVGDSSWKATPKKCGHVGNSGTDK